MTDWKALYQGVLQAAWGYFFLYFDFKLGTVSILPGFVGWLLLLSAIQHLSAERRDLALLRPLGVLLALWNGGDWLASWLGTTLNGRFLPLDLIVAAAALYFHFQLFTDFAALAAKHQQTGDTRDRSLLRCRTVQVLLTTATTLAANLPESGVRDLAVFILTLTGLVVGLCLMAQLFSLRKLFSGDIPAAN